MSFREFSKCQQVGLLPQMEGESIPRVASIEREGAPAPSGPLYSMHNGREGKAGAEVPGRMIGCDQGLGDSWTTLPDGLICQAHGFEQNTCPDMEPMKDP